MKLVREDINEKFVEDSDPIHDMGIGMIFKIKKWIEDMNNTTPSEFGIRNYKINKDFSISVKGTCSLPNYCGNLPDYIKFKTVSGGFLICNCEMTTLRGCPISVGAEFNCGNNKLTSLKYAPKYVGDLFICDNNANVFTDNDVLKYCNVNREKIIC